MSVYDAAAREIAHRALSIVLVESASMIARLPRHLAEHVARARDAALLRLPPAPETTPAEPFRRLDADGHAQWRAALAAIAIIRATACHTVRLRQALALSPAEYVSWMQAPAAPHGDEREALRQCQWAERILNDMGGHATVLLRATVEAWREADQPLPGGDAREIAAWLHDQAIWAITPVGAERLHDAADRLAADAGREADLSGWYIFGDAALTLGPSGADDAAALHALYTAERVVCGTCAGGELAHDPR